MSVSVVNFDRLKCKEMSNECRYRSLIVAKVRKYSNECDASLHHS